VSKTAAVLVAVVGWLVAVPVAAQDYDYNPFSETWERKPYAERMDEQRRLRDPGGWALEQFGPDDESFRLEYEARQEYNRQAPCALSNFYNEAAKQACWDSLR